MLESYNPHCQKCKRLSNFLKKVKKENASYFCKPVPAFGDKIGQLLIVCLAPGMHGANRLASNSLLEAVVFANRAAEHFASNTIQSIETVPEWRAEGMLKLEEHAPLVRDLETLRKTMTDDVGIVRTFNRLERAKRMLVLLSNEVDLIWRRSIPTRELVELRNLVLVATHITEDAINRNQNRGLHWNKDLI